MLIVSIDSSRLDPEQNCLKTVLLTMNKKGNLKVKIIFKSIFPKLVNCLFEMILNKKYAFSNSKLDLRTKPIFVLSKSIKNN